MIRSIAQCAGALLAAVMLARFSIALAGVLLAMSIGNRAIVRHHWVQFAEIGPLSDNRLSLALYDRFQVIAMV
jgi:hypothetical protein